MILVSLSLVFMEPTTNKCYHQKCKMQVALTRKLMFGIFLLSRKLLLMKGVNDGNPTFPVMGKSMIQTRHLQ